METLSFAFGMLTVIGAAFAALVVVGIVKVFKMQKQISSLQLVISNAQDEIHQRITHEGSTLSGAINRQDREINQRITHEGSELSRVIGDDRREINQRVDQLNSYVDSRLDKLESKFIGNSAKKQIIND